MTYSKEDIETGLKIRTEIKKQYDDKLPYKKPFFIDIVVNGENLKFIGMINLVPKCGTKHTCINMYRVVWGRMLNDTVLCSEMFKINSKNALVYVGMNEATKEEIKEWNTLIV